MLLSFYIPGHIEDVSFFEITSFLSGALNEDNQVANLLQNFAGEGQNSETILCLRSFFVVSHCQTSCASYFSNWFLTHRHSAYFSAVLTKMGSACQKCLLAVHWPVVALHYTTAPNSSAIPSAQIILLTLLSWPLRQQEIAMTLQGGCPLRKGWPKIDLVPDNNCTLRVGSNHLSDNGF